MRITVHLPENDPAFTDVREYMRVLAGGGRHGQQSRAAGELMLVGFRFRLGYGAPSEARPALTDSTLPDPQQVLADHQQRMADQQQLLAALSQFNFDD